MKRFLVICMFLVFTMPAGAVDEGQVKYYGGTVPTLQTGLVGHLDTTSPTTLSSNFSGNRLLIPYVKLDSYESTEEVARHLGVVPAIFVSMIRKRQRRHFFRITYHDENELSQVAIFEVSKSEPRVLMAILQDRVPSGCRASFPSRC